MNHVLLDRGVDCVDHRLVQLISNRYIKTVCSNCHPDVSVVKSGIRQGGILSLILFNMYIDIVMICVKLIIVVI